MAIPESERIEIKQEAEFLERLGYIMIDEDSYLIRYRFNNIRIDIVYPTPSGSEMSEVGIHFIKENRSFSIDRIAYVRDNIKGSPDVLVNVKIVLHYLRENYFSITDYQYCVESAKLIHNKYLEELSEYSEIFIGNFPHGGTNLVKTYLDEQRNNVSKDKACRVSIHEFSDEGNLMYGREDRL